MLLFSILLLILVKAVSSSIFLGKLLYLFYYCSSSQRLAITFKQVFPSFKLVLVVIMLFVVWIRHALVLVLLLLLLFSLSSSPLTLLLLHRLVLICYSEEGAHNGLFFDVGLRFAATFT